MRSTPSWDSSAILRRLPTPLSAEPLVSADFGSRAVAKIVDVIGVLAVMCPIAWMASRLVPPGFGPPVMILVGLGGGSLVCAVYTMAAEYRRGQTLGKRLQHIRVVREAGSRISVGQTVVRQLPMLLRCTGSM
jgi:uncharacterized RDD family membrane protein YckC